MTAPNKPRVTFELRNGNRDFYECTDREQLASGPAGTGKTLTALLKLYTLADAFPGSRHLIVRNTRTELTESALLTWERDVLGRDHPSLTKNPSIRRVRQSYVLPNRSEVIVAGLDKPGKTLSTEYDSIYVQEATEVSLESWETLFRALRSPVMPWHCIYGDCNPTFPHHWLYQRAIRSKVISHFPTTHKDNARFWSNVTNDWTKDGRDYLDKLKAMTGHRRQRFLEGIWAAAEGLVYDQFGDHNILPAGWKPPKEWPRYWAVDWGHTAPLVLQFWAIDPDKRMYLYREYYRTLTLVRDLAEWAKKEVNAGNEPRPRAVVCDHDPENVAQFEKYTGIKPTPADKEDRKGGIQFVQERVRLQTDLRPRLFIVDKCRTGPPDHRLSDAGKPTCTQEEFSGYVWNPKTDMPIEDNDHGCDSTRYLATHLDRRGDVGNVW